MVIEKKYKSLLVRKGVGARIKQLELQYNMVNVTMWDAQSIVRVAAFSWMESRQVFQREQQLSQVFQER